MRRFTQTFVLAKQSPKKYYVHNDIFRYQDVFPEEEEADVEGEVEVGDGSEREIDETGRSEVDEDEHQPPGQQHLTANTATNTEQPNQPLMSAQQPLLPPQQQLYYPTQMQNVLPVKTVIIFCFLFCCC